MTDDNTSPESPSPAADPAVREIKLWGALRPYADGADSVPIAAATIREMFSKLRERYPGMIPLMDQGVAVSIDGDIYRDSWNKPLPEGAEIYLLPRIEGG